MSDGLEALRKLRGRAYRLVLTDLEMPRMDGFELLAELGRQGTLATTPVVLASTRSDPDTRRRARELGALAFLAKPIEPNELARAVSAALSLEGFPREDEAPSGPNHNGMIRLGRSLALPKKPFHSKPRGSLMESPLILVIDDSPTIRKMVECHLSQAGYRVALAVDAERGLEQARALRPNLILLDHQLPGTTGDEVCRHLLEDERTARIPVVISSAMRNRAFARYTEFPNIVDQIPKPFTPELLKSGVANALQMGALVVQAQRTGSAMPEAVGEDGAYALEGHTSAFPFRAVLDFLNNGQYQGRLALETGKDRIKFLLSGGRIQAVVSATVAPARLEEFLPADMADLAPLLALTLSEQQDPTMGGLIRLVERSLSDPRRLRALLRLQAAALTRLALSGEPGKFAFEPKGTIPPMFQAFPLQISLAALAVEACKRCDPPASLESWGGLIFARQAARGANLDRAGLTPSEMKVHTLLDGSLDLASLAGKAGLAAGRGGGGRAGAGVGRAGRAAEPGGRRVGPGPRRRPRDGPARAAGARSRRGGLSGQGRARPRGRPAFAAPGAL